MTSEKTARHPFTFGRASRNIRAKLCSDGLEIVEAQIREFRFNRYLYQLVGEPWQWSDMLKMSDAEWRDYAERDTLRT